MQRILNIAFVVGILAVASGGVAILVLGSGGNAIEVTLPTPVPSSTAELKVHVSGAVNDPGVHIIWDGARVQDATAGAGGPTEDADLDAMNLARRVNDEDKVDVPKVGEAPSGSDAQASSGLIDLNSVDVITLTSLPGIGQTKAEAIVRHREQNGPFARIEDLLEVSGIGPATFDAILDLIEVR